VCSPEGILKQEMKGAFHLMTVYHPKGLYSVLPRSYKKSQIIQICCTHKKVHLFEGFVSEVQ